MTVTNENVSPFFSFFLFIKYLALPRHDPIISGLGYRYEIGDFVVANCTSDISYPPPILAWYINDIKVSVIIIYYLL